MFRKTSFCLLAGSLVSLTAAVSTAGVVTLQPVDDAFISTISGEDNTPFGNADQLAMTGWLDIGARRALLKFDLSPIPDGWKVLSAELTLQQVYIHPTSWSNFPAEAWRMPNDNWDEATVTWNSYGQTGGVEVAILPGHQVNGPRVWNIRIADWNYAEDLLDDTVTFEMRWGQELSQHFKSVGYSSKEGTVAPTLRIEYVLPGDWDEDLDIDLDDHAAFPACMSGPWEGPGFVLPAQDCRDAFDFDADTDVDLSDWARFQTGFTG